MPNPQPDQQPTTELRMCATCGKWGGVCRWVDDPSPCMKRQLVAMREALEQARDCISGETPEDCTPEEAKGYVIQAIRKALSA